MLALIGAIIVSALEFDQSGVDWAATLSPGTIHIFEQITRLGDSGYVFALTILAGATAVWLRDRAWRRRTAQAFQQVAARAMYLFAVAAVSGLASQALKHLFGRARPQLHQRFPDMIGVYHFDAFSIFASYASFPSGHTVTAFAMALAIFYLSPRWGAPLFAVAIAVGMSRVAIGSHYVSDVIAGVALGLVSAIALRRAFARRRLVFARRRDGAIALRGATFVRRVLARS